MGQTLSEPVVEKHSSAGSNERFIYGLSDMQGWRISMEDAHTAILELTSGNETEITSFFGVFDGHGGAVLPQFKMRLIRKENESRSLQARTFTKLSAIRTASRREIMRLR